MSICTKVGVSCFIVHFLQIFSYQKFQVTAKRAREGFRWQRPGGENKGVKNQCALANSLFLFLDLAGLHWHLKFSNLVYVAVLSCSYLATYRVSSPCCERWSTLCPPARSERWAKLLTRLMSAVYKGQYGTVLSERFQKALLSSGDREALENMKKGEEVSVKCKKERPCEKRIRICRCLCQFYGSSGWKLCQVVNMKTLKTSILGRRGSCWRSDEWRSGLFPWQPPRWRHGWGQDGLQMGCSSVCGSVWWRIVWWTGWNHVARDVWPQGRAAFIIFITSSSKEKSKEERPRKGNRLVQDVSFAKDKPLWMKFMVLLVLLYSRESCMMQSIVENAWTFTANQLRSLMKKQVREGEGSISLEWDYLDYLHNFLETHHMFAAKKWELIRLRISQRCLESEADRLHHRDYNSQTEQTWTNDKRRQNWSQHHTTHVTTIEDTCIARRHCQWHIIYARLQRLKCTFQVEVAGKSETWKAQNAHENSWKLLQVIRSLS